MTGPAQLDHVVPLVLGDVSRRVGLLAGRQPLRSALHAREQSRAAGRDRGGKRRDVKS